MNETEKTTDGRKTTETAGNGEHGTSSEKTITQAELSKMMSKEKNQGRAAAYRDLGIDPKDQKAIDELKEYLKNKGKTAENGNQPPATDTETNRKLDEITRKLQEADRKAFLAEVKAEILQSGIQSAYLDDASTLILAKRNDDDFDLKEAIETFKTKHPAWFGVPKPKGTTGTGYPPPPGRDDKNQPDDLGARLAAQRKTDAGKNSCWGNP